MPVAGCVTTLQCIWPYTYTQELDDAYADETIEVWFERCIFAPAQTQMRQCGCSTCKSQVVGYYHAARFWISDNFTEGTEVDLSVIKLPAWWPEGQQLSSSSGAKPKSMARSSSSMCSWTMPRGDRKRLRDGTSKVAEPGALPLPPGPVKR